MSDKHQPEAKSGNLKNPTPASAPRRKKIDPTISVICPLCGANVTPFATPLTAIRLERHLRRKHGLEGDRLEMGMLSLHRRQNELKEEKKRKRRAAQKPPEPKGKRRKRKRKKRRRGLEARFVQGGSASGVRPKSRRPA
jgi:hypothetical protein